MLPRLLSFIFKNPCLHQCLLPRAQQSGPEPFWHVHHDSMWPIHLRLWDLWILGCIFGTRWQNHGDGRCPESAATSRELWSQKHERCKFERLDFHQGSHWASWSTTHSLKSPPPNGLIMTSYPSPPWIVVILLYLWFECRCILLKSVFISRLLPTAAGLGKSIIKINFKTLLI